MRELTMKEVGLVAGGHDSCSSEGSGNSYGGVRNTSSLGQDLIQIYEGLVQATSHVIERIANAFK